MQQDSQKRKDPAKAGGPKPIRKYMWVLWLLLLIPLVYFAVQVALIMTPNMSYEVATLHTMTRYADVVGQVVLNSQPVYRVESGYLYYTVPIGQRVSGGSEVALVFDTEAGVQAMDSLKAIDAEIANLELAQKTVAAGGDMDVLLGDMYQGLNGVLSGIESGNYTAIDKATNEMTLASNKMQIATGQATDFSPRLAQLNNVREQYAAACHPRGAIVAPEVGFFVPSFPRDAIAMDYAAISELPPLQLREALAQQPEYYGEDVVGHIVSDFKWSFFFTVSAKESEQYFAGDKSLRLSFPDENNLTVPVKVQQMQLDEENDVALVELSCEYVSPEVLMLRVEQAQIIFAEHKGIRLSKSALRLKDEMGTDGSVNTYKGVYIEFGNMVYFKRIDIIMEDDFYMLIAKDPVKDINEVQLYDKVIIDSAGVELYDKKIL